MPIATLSSETPPGTPDGDPWQRRSLLVTCPNPDPRADLLVSVRFAIEAGTALGPVRVALRYVPDRRVLDTDALEDYRKALAAGGWTQIEGLAVAVRDDLNNEVVPRWLQLRLRSRLSANGTESSHGVMVEDRQPGWNNPALLSRLARY